MAEKLKPCPFCGGTPELIVNNPCALILYIRCPECKAMIVRETQNADDTKKDEDARQAVIKAWNTRTDCSTQVLTPEGWKPAKYIEFEPPKWYFRPLAWLIDLFIRR